MYFVYILRGINSKFYYKGLTNNIDRRLDEHAGGRNKFTKRYLPLRLLHVELCSSREEARELEKFFKSGYGRDIIKELESYI